MNALLFIIMVLVAVPSIAETGTLYYSGEILDFLSDEDPSIQLELEYSGVAVTGLFVRNTSGKIFILEGGFQNSERMNLQVFSNNIYFADIKLAKRISGDDNENYNSGTIHWIGFLFEQGRESKLVHLVETETREKHPAYTEFGRLPGGAYLMDLSYNPETGKQIYDPENDEMVGKGLKGAACVGNGVPWADCKLNYHPVDGCYLTEAQRKTCRQGPFDQLISGITGNCWAYDKGPGLQLPFQQGSISMFDLSDVEILAIDKGKAELAEAKKVAVTKESVRSGRNFLNRPVCKNAFAHGPMDLGYLPVPLPPE